MSFAQARRHDGLADGDVGRGDQVSEDRLGSGMDLGRAMGCEGGIVGVDLGGPEHDARRSRADSRLPHDEQ